MHHSTPNVNAPPYPAVQGQKMPDLNLAGISTSRTDLSGGNFTDATPPQNISVPSLSTSDPNGDLNMLGIDPGVSYFELNLAGNAIPIPSPASLTTAGGKDTMNAPTFGTQNYDVPANKPFDLAGPGIDQVPALQPDPPVSDLLQFDQPRGLAMFAASSTPMMPEAMAPDLSQHDRPEGLFMPGPLMVDPALPDLQNPTLTQQVMMPDRPADLNPNALTILHQNPTYQQEPASSYEALWMAQAGNNHARERHLGMLMYGLDREES